MRYTSAKNQIRHGAVWSPGPVANSLWLIDDEAGEPVAVKLPKGNVSAAYEFDYATPEFVDADQHHGPRWVHNSGRDYRGLPRLSCVPTEDYRYAPKLPEKVWRAAVGNQCEQLELTAA